MGLTVAERITVRRKRLNMSQQDLADLVGLSKNAICRIERAETNPSMARVIAIAKALDFSDLADFMAWPSSES